MYKSFAGFKTVCKCVISYYIMLSNTEVDKYIQNPKENPYICLQLH